MKNKFLVTINKLNDIDKLKKLGITNFVFPLKDFSIGYETEFSLNEIKEDAFILVNRMFDNELIDNFKKIIENMNENIKGIIFDDLGILNIVKDLNLEKILYLSHFNMNSASVNIYNNYVDSILISPDITYEELKDITNNSLKELTIFTLGFMPLMYSRRYLIDNYIKYHNLERKNPLYISNTNKDLIIYENNYGTIIYSGLPLCYKKLLDLSCKYYFINSVFLSIEDITYFILNHTLERTSTNGFLDKETIYKLRGDLNA